MEDFRAHPSAAPLMMKKDEGRERIVSAVKP